MNHKFFFLFVFYTMNTCITAIFMIVVRAIRCGHKYESPSSTDEAFIASTTYNTTVDGEEEIREEEVAGDMDETRDLFRGLQSLAPSPFVYEECEDFHSTKTVLVLFIVAVTFLIFTACMLVEQMEAIHSGQGKIARMVSCALRGRSHALFRLMLGSFLNFFVIENEGRSGRD
jgi:hypothetical protein